MNLQKIISTISLGAVFVAGAAQASMIGGTIKAYDVGNDELRESGGADIHDSTFTKVQFSVDLTDDYAFGAVFDLDEDQKNTGDMLIRLGFGDWIFGYEQGKIEGKFTTGEFLTWQPSSGEFSHDYIGYELLESGQDEFNHGGLQFGIAYANWTQPAILTAGSSTNFDSVEYVEPETEVELLTLVMNRDVLTSMVFSYEREGFNWETRSEVGLITITPSTFGKSAAENELGEGLDYGGSTELGLKTTVRLGYFGEFFDTYNVESVYAIGWEGHMLGNIGTSLSDDGKGVASISQMGNGFFARVYAFF